MNLTTRQKAAFGIGAVGKDMVYALVLYALFAAPALDGAAMMVYFSVVYVLWGVTYTMMDIPYWSMIPAVTRTPADRENLSMVGRTCAGVGSALFHNDQAMVVVGSIVLINSALYLTSNFIIYFFKYDFGGAGWKATYTLFSTIGGAAQILGMMVLYPLLRKKFSSTQVFRLSLVLALGGYGMLLVFCLTGLAHSLVLFHRKFTLTDERAAAISAQLHGEAAE